MNTFLLPCMYISKVGADVSTVIFLVGGLIKGMECSIVWKMLLNRVRKLGQSGYIYFNLSSIIEGVVASRIFHSLSCSPLVRKYAFSVYYLR